MWIIGDFNFCSPTSALKVCWFSSPSTTIISKSDLAKTLQLASSKDMQKSPPRRCPPESGKRGSSKVLPEDRNPEINKVRQLQNYFPPSCNQHPSSTPHQFCVEHMLLPLNTPLSIRPVWTSRRQGKPPNWPEPVRLPWVMVMAGVSRGQFIRYQAGGIGAPSASSEMKSGKK